MIRCLMFVFIFINISIHGFDPVIILFGPPGSGKGTLSQHLKMMHQYHHISAGDVVRREIHLQTPIGLEIQEIIRRGDHIDSKVMDDLIEKKVAELVHLGGPLIIDGFVHSERDLESLCLLIDRLGIRSRSFILFIEANDVSCSQRISDRLVCLQCGYVYNKNTIAPKLNDKCNICNGDLKQRINDTSLVVEKRIHEYRINTAPTFQKAITLFPALVYKTDKPIISCFHFYSYLAERAKNFQGSTEEFVNEITLALQELRF